MIWHMNKLMNNKSKKTIYTHTWIVYYADKASKDIHQFKKKKNKLKKKPVKLLKKRLHIAQNVEYRTVLFVIMFGHT